MIRRLRSSDLTLIWLLATNCRIYGEDSGHTELNAASEVEPQMVSRMEAFRDLYAHLLLVDLDADSAADRHR